MNLPDGFPHKAPAGYNYEVRNFKRNVVSIWLQHHASFSYTSDPVYTIWGFYDTKKECYIAPINHKRPGKVVDINDTRDFTAMQLNLNPLEHALYSSGR